MNKITSLLSESAHDYTLSSMRSLFKFYNPAGSAIRHVLVTNAVKRSSRSTPDGQDARRQMREQERLLKEMLASESRTTGNMIEVGCECPMFDY